MNFFMKNLTIFTILVIAIWVMPASSNKSDLAKGYCKNFIVDVIKFENDTTDYVISEENIINKIKNLQTKLSSFDKTKWSNAIRDLGIHDVSILKYSTCELCKYLKFLLDNQKINRKEEHEPVVFYCNERIKESNYTSYFQDLLNPDLNEAPCKFIDTKLSIEVIGSAINAYFKTKYNLTP